MLRFDAHGVLHARDRDHAVSALLRPQRCPDDRSVHTGVRGDHEDVALAHRDRRHQLVDQPGFALQCAGQNVHFAIAMHHEVAQRELVGRDEPARPAGDLHRERLGVTGAEGVDHSAGIQRRDHQLDRGIEGAGFGIRSEAGEAIVRLTEQIGRCRGQLAASWISDGDSGGSSPERWFSVRGRRCADTAVAVAASRRVAGSNICCAMSR